MWIFALIIVAVFSVVLLLSACKVASQADEQMERTFQEWLARQPKEVQQDASLVESRHKRGCI